MSPSTLKTFYTRDALSEAGHYQYRAAGHSKMRVVRQLDRGTLDFFEFARTLFEHTMYGHHAAAAAEPGRDPGESAKLHPTVFPTALQGRMMGKSDGGYKPPVISINEERGNIV